MKKVSSPPRPNHYYVPYHAVAVESKFRVVCDASCKTSSGKSFNDIQWNGPKLQDNLSDIVNRFRLKKVALLGDIEKMYRMMYINKSQLDYQRIFWRESPQQPLEEYQLQVVTYGMKASGYNAVKCLLQCAADVEQKKPAVADSIKNNFYMDDYISGADNTDDAIELYAGVTQALEAGGFHLRKWASNDPLVTGVFPAQNRMQAAKRSEISLSNDNDQSILGLLWPPDTDKLKIKFTPIVIKSHWTKREIMSIQ